MGKIYGFARRVIIWLGNQTKDTELAFQLMNETAYGTRYAEALLSALKKGEVMLQHCKILDAEASDLGHTRVSDAKSNVLGDRIAKITHMLQRHLKSAPTLEPLVMRVH
jgi:hypothetical protein